MSAIAIRVLQDERGATAIEYSVTACGIALAIAAAVAMLGSNTTALYVAVASVVP